MARILRPHPHPSTEIGSIIVGADGETVTQRHHRLLIEQPSGRPQLVKFLRDALARHHADADARGRMGKINEALERQGFPLRSVYPADDNTRKGNLAEVVLAEYVVASEQISLPVYRLRYNPNVDQAMKGDDVLAFDLDAKPMRILVGESKFRSTPRREHVEEIVAALLRSHNAKIPVSLQFVADRLYEQGKIDLARRVEECQLAIARGTVNLDYVGLLFGSASSANIVKKYTPDGEPARLAMISFGTEDPETLVVHCFHDLT